MKNLALFAIFIAYSCNVWAAPPTISGFLPVSATTGMTVTINGTDFIAVSAVSFGGTPASSFTVVSATQITAVVGVGTTGSVQVQTADGTAARVGFTYVPLSRIITDFNGYWSSTGANPNPVLPDSSHNLIAFTYRGQTFSTGANNGILNANGISYTPGNYKALPVAGITGVTAGGSTFLALASKCDRSANIGYVPAVAHYTIKNALVDGLNGLDLGTGFTNLPTAAVMRFQIFNINASALSNTEPDIILTQIAQPVTGNDEFSFVDANGVQVGNTITQDMVLLPNFGTYRLDLFNLTPTTSYNTATAYSASAINTTREIRLTGLKLSDFGINAGNVGQIKALRIAPSGNRPASQCHPGSECFQYYGMCRWHSQPAGACFSYIRRDADVCVGSFR